MITVCERLVYAACKDGATCLMGPFTYYVSQFLVILNNESFCVMLNGHLTLINNNNLLNNYWLNC